MKKRTLVLFTTMALVTAGTMSAVFTVSADSGIKSKGNLILEGDGVDICTADFADLHSDLDGLKQELPNLPDEGSGIPAESFVRKNAIRSKGIINYDDSTVVIDSADLIALADEMDALEYVYKTDMMTALNQIGTYYDAEGSITHNSEDNAFSAGRAHELPFSQIYQGVLQSQSVAHLAEQQILPASEENLSAGTAAWVNGELIIGNGADNESAYSAGKQDSVHKVVFSLYNNTTVKYELPSERSVTATLGSDGTKDEYFTYTSDPIYLYKTPEGNTAALNTISFVRSYSSHHPDSSGCGCALSQNILVEVYLEDGTCIYSDNFELQSNNSSYSENTTINLFDHSVGENTYCYMTVSGTASVRRYNHHPNLNAPYITSNFSDAIVSYIPVNVD